jgi:biopolymer transport protein ExbD
MAVKLKNSSATTALSITPLIDVVFLLLIFFLVTTRFEKTDREMEFPLPSASEAQPVTEEPNELFVNIDQEGKYFVNGQQRTADQVESILQQANTDNPLTQSVILRADKRVPVDYVVVVANICNKVGIKSYTINTDSE